MALRNEIMRVLREIPQEELNKRTEAILEGIGITPGNHNSIAYQHTIEFAQLLLRCEGLTPDHFKHLAKITLCLSEKYIEQYYKGFVVWGVFRVHEKKIVLTDMNNNGHSVHP